MYVNGAGQLVIDSGATSGNHRGFLLTNLDLPATNALAVGLDPDQVGMSVSFDVISTTSAHAGALLFGAAADPDTGNAAGTKMYDGFCSQSDGAGGLYQWPQGTPFNSDVGPGLINAAGWDNGTGSGNVGHNVRLEWLKNSAGLNELDHGIIYIDGVMQPSSFMESPDAQAGSIGFWMLLDRDAVIDNLEIKAVTGATLISPGGPLSAADGTYPEYWTRTGSAPTYLLNNAQARLGQDCIRAAWIPPVGYPDANAYTTDATMQGPIFTHAAAHGNATDYTLSTYWKTAADDDDGLAAVGLRVKAIDHSSPATIVSDTSQTFAVSGSAWQRLVYTVTGIRNRRSCLETNLLRHTCFEREILPIRFTAVNLDNTPRISNDVYVHFSFRNAQYANSYPISSEILSSDATISLS